MWLSYVAQLFFAKVLRSANEEQVWQLFNKFGRVIEVNLFRAFQVTSAEPYTARRIRRTCMLCYLLHGGLCSTHCTVTWLSLPRWRKPAVWLNLSPC
jgi:hypothetical protein